MKRLLYSKAFLGTAFVALCFASVLGLRARHCLALDGCIEQSNSTADDNQCYSTGAACQAKQKQVTFSFNLSGNVLALQAGGAIEWQYSVDDGCDPNAVPNEARDSCGRSLNSKMFTAASGPITGLKQTSCDPYKVYNCANGMPTQTDLSGSNSFRTWLGTRTFGGTLNAWSTPCARAQNPANTFTCPGQNGAQTYFYVINDACLPE